MRGWTVRLLVPATLCCAAAVARPQPDGPAVSLGTPVVLRSDVPAPPPPPAAVNQPERIRQFLRPGKTYVTHVKGTLTIRAVDSELLAQVVVTLNYAFEAQIDREIEFNDGRTIVELRHFRDVRALKVGSTVEGVRIEPGKAGSLLLDGLSLIGPLAIAQKVVIGANVLSRVLVKLPWVQGGLQRLLANPRQVAAVALVDQLTGKSVRLTYVDGRGVIRMEAVRGAITASDRDLYVGSSLLSDCLIVPDADIPVGVRWPVEGSSFSNLFDLALRARLDGELSLERTPDYLIPQRLSDGRVAYRSCRRIQVADGRLTLLDESDPTQKVGYVEPRGFLYFDPQDQLIVQARLEGTGEIQRFSRNHLLFTARQMRQPTLRLVYTCYPIDTPPK